MVGAHHWIRFWKKNYLQYITIQTGECSDVIDLFYCDKNFTSDILSEINEFIEALKILEGDKNNNELILSPPQNKEIFFGESKMVMWT